MSLATSTVFGSSRITPKFTAIHLSNVKPKPVKQYLLFGNLVPGHGSSLQERACSLLPGHEFPPNCGGGLVQVLDLFCTPPPHVTGQSLQSSQSDQLPSTKDVNWLN